MVAVRIFVILIKNYLIKKYYMAEKDKKEDKKKNTSYSKGGMSFGVEILLFVIVIFILWILTGGSKKEPASTDLFNVSKEITPIIPTRNYSN